MNINVVKGDPARLEEYCSVFYNSPLYDHYFADGQRLPAYLTSAMEKGQLYVAEDSHGQAVGVMHMTMDGMAGLPYLNLLGVRESYRGMGIGSDLIRVFIGVAETAGAPNMFIMTSAFNVRAKQLYQSMGFVKQCLLPNVMMPGVSEYLFMRPSSVRGW